MTDWRAAIGMRGPPDHNTLWRAFGALLKPARMNRALDLMADDHRRTLAAALRAKPLAINATHLEPRHRSRHYDRVCRKHAARDDDAPHSPGKGGERVNAARRLRLRLRRMPKLAIVAAMHQISRGQSEARRGVRRAGFRAAVIRRAAAGSVRTVVADAGYDSEANHRTARLDLGVRSVIPAARRPAGRAAAGGVLSRHHEEAIQAQGRRQGVQLHDVAVTTAAATMTAVPGRIFDDVNNNGVYDAGTDSPRTTDVLYVDRDGDGIYDGHDVGCRPASDGTYSFSGLPADFTMAYVRVRSSVLSFQEPSFYQISLDGNRHDQLNFAVIA